jgi:hypothetical protein
MSNSYCYLASRFRHRYILQGYRQALSRINIHTTSRWLDLKDEDESQLAACAKTDAADIEISDLLISFPEPARSLPPTRGGHFWEEGFAYGTNKRVMVVGNRVHVFHYLPDVEFFASWNECLAALTREQQMKAAA